VHSDIGTAPIACQPLYTDHRTVQDVRSGGRGARKHRNKGSDVLAQNELARATRGEDFKRLVRAAAALVGIYDDKALAEAVGRQRNTVAGWWRGAKPEPDTIQPLGRVTRLDADELYRYLYLGGPVPRLAQPGSPADRALQEGLRQGLRPQPPEDPELPGPLPRPRPGGTD